MNKLKDQIIDLHERGFSYNKIQEKLKCSKGTISFHCKGLSNPRVKKKLDESIIEKLNNDLFSGLTYYEILRKYSISKTTLLKYKKHNKNIRWKELSSFEKENLIRNNNTTAYRKRRKKIKDQAVEYKGGKCKKCGYNRCTAALEFHHIDPSKKDFIISANYKKSWAKIKEELDKTILLCSNCHREFHSLVNVDINEFLIDG